jgi:hypothetical protein
MQLLSYFLLFLCLWRVLDSHPLKPNWNYLAYGTIICTKLNKMNTLSWILSIHEECEQEAQGPGAPLTVWIEVGGLLATWPRRGRGVYILSCGIFSLPWHRYSGTRNFGFTSHSKDEAIEVKWLAQGHNRGGPWWVLNPRCSDTLASSAAVVRQYSNAIKTTFQILD